MKVDPDDTLWEFVAQAIPGPEQELMTFEEIYARLAVPRPTKQRVMSCINALVDEGEVVMYGSPMMRMGDVGLLKCYRWTPL